VQVETLVGHSPNQFRFEHAIDLEGRKGFLGRQADNRGRHFINGPPLDQRAQDFVGPLITKTEFSTRHCATRPTGVSIADDSGLHNPIFTGRHPMAKKAKARRAWTTEHVRTLKTMAHRKKPASAIAKRLKRTEGATRQKAFSMGISLDSRA
jgi:hypothetical protein